MLELQLNVCDIFSVVRVSYMQPVPVGNYGGVGELAVGSFKVAKPLPAIARIGGI